MATKDITDTQVCKAYMLKIDFPEILPYKILQEWTNQPEKVCKCACKRTHERGYIAKPLLLIGQCNILNDGFVTSKGHELMEGKIDGN